MRVTICGSRGSTPAPGSPYVRTGGHTSCVAIAPDGGGPPVLVLDAGTGLQRCSELLEGRAFRGTIVLSHLHWDHTHGLPFFPAGDRAEARVELLVPAGGCASPADLLARAMSPPHFPIRPEQLGGRWTFGVLSSGRRTIEGFTLDAREIPHSNSPTFGVRVESAAGRSLAYLPDHAPHLLGPGEGGVGVLHEAALHLARDVDLLIHDAHFTRDELAERPHYGHSCAEYATELAAAAGARRVLLFHHEPRRSDDHVEAIAADIRARCDRPVDPATEGMVIQL